jgi:hypothetical protein
MALPIVTAKVRTVTNLGVSSFVQVSPRTV